MRSKVEVKENGEVITTTTRVKAEPRHDLADRFRKMMGKVRDHRRKWPQPADASIILPMHFMIHSVAKGGYHADMTLEIPTASGVDYFTISKSAKNRHDALILLIQEIENSTWFTVFKEEGTYFKVTGAGMESLYRGFL